MASISASIQLYDRMSSPLNNIMSAMNQTISCMYDMTDAMNTGIDTSSLDAAVDSLNQASAEMEQIAQEANGAGQQQDKFNQEVQQGQNAMQGLESAVQKVVAAIGGMFAIKKVIGWIDDCTSAADTQNAAMTQLATTIANTGGGKEQYQALVDKAAEIQQMGMYGDEALIGAAAEFATYMSDTSAIELMMDTLSDYAAGMSGGGAIDYDAMVNYATNLGKITTGAYDAMTKKGFEFTDAQKAVIDGTATEAQYVEALGSDWKDMSEDMRSAQVIADIINESWSGMYQTLSATPEAQLISLKNTFGDIQEAAGNRMYQALGGLWTTIADNMPIIEQVIMSAANGLTYIIGILDMIVQGAANVAGFIQDNWTVIEPIIMGIVTALGLYLAALTIGKVIMAASAAVTAIHTAMTSGWTVANFAATASQQGLNAALLACPLTWIILLVIALIAAIVAVCSWIAKTSGVANSAFGVITGGVNVVIQFFKNLGLTVANIALGIWEALGACAANMGIAFNNVICSIQSWFYNLLSTALSVIAGICAALNKLPFVEFDYSGITSAADNYAAKAAEAAGNKQEYQSVGDAFQKGMNTFDTFQDGWAADAFAAGAAWGDGISDKVSGFFNGGDTGVDVPGAYDPASILDNSDMTRNIADSSGATAANTGAIADSLDITNENLKYLRDAAETEAINRFTTAEIKVEMTNNNTVSGGMDIDGMIEQLSEGVLEAMEQAAEGVH